MIEDTRRLGGRSNRIMMLGYRLRTDKNDLPLVNVKKWYVSEKFDGYRGYWDGKRMIARSGRIMNCPAWFTDRLPNGVRMDGELFAGYGTRTKLAGMTRNSKNPWWGRIKFMVFDLPNDRPFHERVQALQKLRKSSICTIVKYSLVRSESHLRSRFRGIRSRGGEGLVLRDPTSLYINGRSQKFLKYLPH